MHMKKLTNLLQWRQFGAFLKVSFLLFVFFPNLHSEINEVWLEINCARIYLTQYERRTK